MISIKSQYEVELMRKANQIVKDALNLIEDNIKEGMTTAALDKLAHDYIVKCDAYPSFWDTTDFLRRYALR